MHKLVSFPAVLLSAALSLASAQTTTPTSDVAGQALVSLVQLVHSGEVITLLDAKGKPVATVTAGGTLELVAGATLSSATTVSLKGSAVTATYALATRATASGTLFVTQTNPQGHTLTLPLIAAVNRAAAAARSEAARPAEADKPAEAGKPTEAGKPAEAGSKGRGPAEGGSKGPGGKVH